MTTVTSDHRLSLSRTGFSGEERPDPTYDTGRTQIAAESRDEVTS